MLSVRRIIQILVVVTRQLFPLILPRLLFILTLGMVRYPPVETPKALRNILEQLGGAFIKFGQLLAMRPDIVAQSYINEFSVLLDSAPPFPGEIAIAIVERELGEPWQAVFESFAREPIAAASFAQVHKATLLTGESVVVKVQRPDLVRIARADIRLVMVFAYLIDLFGVMKRFRMTKLAREFRDWTFEELDLSVEATYAHRLRNLSTGDPHSYVPKIYWNFTTRSILTMEYLDGIWVSQILARVDRDGLEAASHFYAESGIDFDRVAANILGNGLRQAFEYRLFHADPHAGNLVVLKNNLIGYVDFGITGELDKEFRATQLLIYDALDKRDYSQYMLGVYRLMKPPPENVDLDAFEHDIKRNVREWENLTYNPVAKLQERSSSWLIIRNLRATRKYGLEISQMALRYFRAISVIELIVLRINPKFNFVKALSTYLLQLQLRGIAKETRVESRMRQLLVRRRFLFEAISNMEGRLSAPSGMGAIPRRKVNRWMLGLSHFLKAVAIISALGAVAIPVVSLRSQDVAATLSNLGPKKTILILVLACLFSAWAARKFSIISTEHGIVENRLGG